MPEIKPQMKPYRSKERILAQQILIEGHAQGANITLKTDEGKLLRGRNGDYLVKFVDGDSQLMDHGTFVSAYEPLTAGDDSNPLEVSMGGGAS